MDADIDALHSREEAFHLIGVGAVMSLVRLGVIDTLELVQASEVVIALVLVCEDPGCPQGPGRSPGCVASSSKMMRVNV